MPSQRPLAALASAPSLTLGPTLAAPSLPTAITQITGGELAAFQAQFRAYPLSNPGVLDEALEAPQKRQQVTAVGREAAKIAAYRTHPFEDPNSWAGDNLAGDITLVEFTDDRCSHRRKACAEIESLAANDGNVHFVPKEFPILGAESTASSRFAIAVKLEAGEAACKHAHDALIALRGAPDAETLGRLATELGLDAEAVLARMQAEEVTAIIAANHALAQILAISGTPTFVMGGTVLRGYIPEADMRAVLAEARGG